MRLKTLQLLGPTPKESERWSVNQLQSPYKGLEIPNRNTQRYFKVQLRLLQEERGFLGRPLKVKTVQKNYSNFQSSTTWPFKAELQFTQKFFFLGNIQGSNFQVIQIFLSESRIDHWTLDSQKIKNIRAIFIMVLQYYFI